MSKTLLILAAAVVFGIWTVSAADDKKDSKGKQSEATAAVLKLAADLKPDDPAALRKEAAGLAARYGLEEVMKTTRPSSRGGVGLESRIRALSRNALEKEALTRQADELARLGRVGAVIALVADSQTPKKKGADLKEWKGYAKEMQDASVALLKAVKAGDTKKVQASAERLNTSCTACHSSFRKDND